MKKTQRITLTVVAAVGFAAANAQTPAVPQIAPMTVPRPGPITSRCQTAARRPAALSPRTADSAQLQKVTLAEASAPHLRVPSA